MSNDLVSENPFVSLLKPYSIKFKKLVPEAIIPTRAKEGDAGYDLYLLEPGVLLPGRLHRLHTGVAVEFWTPLQYKNVDYTDTLVPVGLIRARSSAFAKGFMIQGTIDQGYRGELMVQVWNVSQELAVLSAGDRIAQMVVTYAISLPTQEVEELSDSDRGTGAFGCYRKMKEIKPQEYLTFDDVLIEPGYSDLASRKEADTSVTLGETLKLDVPILSANMDTITGPEMAYAMGKAGGAGVLHRYEDASKIYQWVDGLKGVPRIPSVGLGLQQMTHAQMYRELTDSICLDVAHGNTRQVVENIKTLKKMDYKNIIAGNVATTDGVYRLAEAGANIVKVGIGPGSVCTTRLVTGVGVPQLSAIIRCSRWGNTYRAGWPHIIADGGLKTSGDIVKALAAGADAVMSGHFFAGCQEVPGVAKHHNQTTYGVLKVEYRGMASRDAQMEFKGHVGNENPEGVSKMVKVNGYAADVMKELAGGLRSGMSYVGARNLKELRENAVFIKVSSNTRHENGTR